MSHAYHGDLKGIVLFDGCDECENRATHLWEMDVDHLRGITALYARLPEASYADRKALMTLELYARLVTDSGINEDSE